MEQTLGAALAALFKETVPAAMLPSAEGTANARAREALTHYDRAVERLKSGDWSGFGAELDALRPLLEALDGRQHQGWPYLSVPKLTVSGHGHDRTL